MAVSNIGGRFCGRSYNKNFYYLGSILGLLISESSNTIVLSSPQFAKIEAMTALPPHCGHLARETHPASTADTGPKLADPLDVLIQKQTC